MDPLRVVFRSLLRVAQRSGREVTDLFDGLFEEGHGQISHTDLREALLGDSELGVHMKPSQIDQLIAWIDVDNDGFIDKQEMLAAEEVYRFTQGRRPSVMLTSSQSPSTNHTPSSRELELEVLLKEATQQLDTVTAARDKFDAAGKKNKSKLNQVVERWKKLQTKNKKLQQQLEEANKQLAATPPPQPQLQDSQELQTPQESQISQISQESQESQEPKEGMDDVNADLMSELDRMCKRVAVMEEERDGTAAQIKQMAEDCKEAHEECDEWRQTVKDMQVQMDEEREERNAQDEERLAQEKAQPELPEPPPESPEAPETTITTMEHETKVKQIQASLSIAEQKVLVLTTENDSLEHDRDAWKMKATTNTEDAAASSLLEQVGSLNHALEEAHAASNSRAELLGHAHETIQDLQNQLKGFHDASDEDNDMARQLSDLKNNYRRLLDTRDTLEGHNNILKEENASLKTLLRAGSGGKDCPPAEDVPEEVVPKSLLTEKEDELMKMTMMLAETNAQLNTMSDQIKEKDQNYIDAAADASALATKWEEQYSNGQTEIVSLNGIINTLNDVIENNNKKDVQLEEEHQRQEQKEQEQKAEQERVVMEKQQRIATLEEMMQTLEIKVQEATAMAADATEAAEAAKAAKAEPQQEAEQEEGAGTTDEGNKEDEIIRLTNELNTLQAASDGNGKNNEEEVLALRQKEQEKAQLVTKLKNAVRALKKKMKQQEIAMEALKTDTLQKIEAINAAAETSKETKAESDANADAEEEETDKRDLSELNAIIEALKEETQTLKQTIQASNEEITALTKKTTSLEKSRDNEREGKKKYAKKVKAINDELKTMKKEKKEMNKTLKQTTAVAIETAVEEAVEGAVEAAVTSAVDAAVENALAQAQAEYEELMDASKTQAAQATEAAEAAAQEALQEAVANAIRQTKDEATKELQNQHAIDLQSLQNTLAEKENELLVQLDMNQEMNVLMVNKEQEETMQTNAHQELQLTHNDMAQKYEQASKELTRIQEQHKEEQSLHVETHTSLKTLGKTMEDKVNELQTQHNEEVATYTLQL